MTDHSQLVKLERSLERYAKLSPQAVVGGSPAQTLFFAQDAQKDIAALGRAIEALTAERDALRLLATQHLTERDTLQARVEALEAGHRHIARQWPDSFAARHARALLERKA